MQKANCGRMKSKINREKKIIHITMKTKAHGSIERNFFYSWIEKISSSQMTATASHSIKNIHTVRHSVHVLKAVHFWGLSFTEFECCEKPAWVLVSRSLCCSFFKCIPDCFHLNAICMKIYIELATQNVQPRERE